MSMSCLLMDIMTTSDLYPFKFLHFEALHGDKEGRLQYAENEAGPLLHEAIGENP